MLHTHIPRVISGVLSLLQASNLRNRVYAMEDRLDILEVALEDIERINSNSPHSNPLITNVCRQAHLHKHTLGAHYE